MSHSTSTFDRMRRTLHGARGFSLIELLTAIGLIGTLSAIAATNFVAFRPTYRVRGAALTIGGDMNIARLSAVKEGRIWQYLPSGDGYQIRRADLAGGWEVMKQVTIANEFPSVTFGYSGITTDPYGVAITSAVPTGAITFHSNGTVQNPADVFLQVSTSKGLSQQAVSVTAAGRIRVWKRSGTTWK